MGVRREATRTVAVTTRKKKDLTDYLRERQFYRKTIHQNCSTGYSPTDRPTPSPLRRPFGGHRRLPSPFPHPVPEAGGYFIFKVMFLAKMPIAVIEIRALKQFESIVEKIYSLTQSTDYLKNKDKQSKVRKYEKEIDLLVHQSDFLPRGPHPAGT